MTVFAELTTEDGGDQMGDSPEDACRLIVLGVGSRGKSIPIQREVVVGRSEKCDLVLDHRSVSREHARFFLRKGRCFVEDLDSHNGIRVNDEPTRWSELQAGDRIEVGACQIVLRGTPPSSGLLGRLLGYFRT
jgi:adenylate cyclase